MGRAVLVRTGEVMERRPKCRIGYKMKFDGQSVTQPPPHMRLFLRHDLANGVPVEKSLDRRRTVVARNQDFQPCNRLLPATITPRDDNPVDPLNLTEILNRSLGNGFDLI